MLAPLPHLRSILKFALATMVVGLAVPSALRAQGCVIAHGGGGSAMLGKSGLLGPKEWDVTVAHRWFRSDRHFVGTVEQTQRQDNDTQVINNSHFIDFSATYGLSSRYSISLIVPYSIHDRNSLYEHLGNASGQRFHTQAAGLGDVRVAANYWIFNPATTHRGNISVSLGLKAPTGDYQATDTFIRPTGPMLRYVDSSIQPGDGGWGATVETQAFLQLFGSVSGYFNGFYLFNPRERVLATGYSVPDNYLVRIGLSAPIWPAHGLGATLGLRMEGVPSEDVFGGSLGFRRPGYSIGVEPGLSWNVGRFTANISVPIAIERNRQMTYGATRKGDAAFADYSINSSVTARF